MTAPLTTPLPLSTPSTHIFPDPSHPPVPTDTHPTSPLIPPNARLSDQEISRIYEIERTFDAIKAKGWRRIGLQFPDRMLGDGVRVFELLQAALRTFTVHNTGEGGAREQGRAGLWILADTSYSPCCVDAVAAEHVNAEVVVHYGNACLSEVQGVEVLYVFTKQEIDIGSVVKSFGECFGEGDRSTERIKGGEKVEKVVVMADCVYQSHVPALLRILKEKGWYNVVGTMIVQDTETVIPNRRICWREDEMGDLNEYSVFYVGNPASSLLLMLASKIQDFFVCPISSTSSSATTKSVRQYTQILLRKRYALLTSLTTAPVIGILINTLSLTSLLPNLSKIKGMIERARKKSYTVVVGKVNVEKLANFSEVDGWVGLGCWESGLGVREGHDDDVTGAGGITGSGGFWKPVITPFELALVLQSDSERVWSGKWWGGLDGLKDHHPIASDGRSDQTQIHRNGHDEQQVAIDSASDPDSEPESAPPEFDLRTGRYVAQSISRPMKRPPTPDSASTELSAAPKVTSAKENESISPAAAPSSSQNLREIEITGPEERGKTLARRPKGEVSAAMVNGVRSPGAEFLRAKRTWMGLGSDFAATADGGGDEGEGDGREGSKIEEGRRGVARGYVVGDGAQGEEKR